MNKIEGKWSRRLCSNGVNSFPKASFAVLHKLVALEAIYCTQNLFLETDDTIAINKIE